MFEPGPTLDVDVEDGRRTHLGRRPWCGLRTAGLFLKYRAGYGSALVVACDRLTHLTTRSSARRLSSPCSTGWISMFCLHARIPLRLDCESWDGAPSLDLAGFVVVELISAQADLSFFACHP